MAFTPQHKTQISQRAGGQCECTRIACGHIGRCQTSVSLSIANLFGIYPGFEFNHKLSQIAGGLDTVSNGEFLCTNCHQNTRSYGTNLTRG